MASTQSCKCPAHLPHNTVIYHGATSSHQLLRVLGWSWVGTSRKMQQCGGGKVQHNLSEPVISSETAGKKRFFSFPVGQKGKNHQLCPQKEPVQHEMVTDSVSEAEMRSWRVSPIGPKTAENLQVSLGVHSCQDLCLCRNAELRDPEKTPCPSTLGQRDANMLLPADTCNRNFP